MELKYISPYLPHDVLAIDTMYPDDGPFKLTLSSLCGYVHEMEESEGLSTLKLVLRNLSDLTKEIEHNGERFVPCDGIYLPKALFEDNDNSNIAAWLTYEDVAKLFEWHIDVFNLIPEGLAIDYNTLKEKTNVD